MGEAIVATGIDALFYLMEGGTVEMADGRMMKLVQVNPEGEQLPDSTKPTWSDVVEAVERGDLSDRDGLEILGYEGDG